MQRIQLTQEGYHKLQSELDELKQEKRPDAVERLKKARAIGDLSENSEYAAAREHLAFIDGRIMEIETMLENANVISVSGKSNEVALGSRVTVEFDNQKETYQIVGEFEADPVNKKLSITSPIGQALVGKRKEEIVAVDTPSGKITYKIIDIH